MRARAEAPLRFWPRLRGCPLASLGLGDQPVKVLVELGSRHEPVLPGLCLPGRLCRSRALGFGFPGWPGVRLGFGGGYELVEVGAEFRVGHRPVAGAWGCRDPLGLVAPPELGLGRPGCLSVLCVRLGPLAAGGVSDGEPGEVLSGIATLRLRLGCRFGVHVVPGDVTADLGVLPCVLALADLRLDILRGGRRSPVIRGDDGLEIAAAHGPQQGLIVGQLQGHYGGVERLTSCAWPEGTGPSACARSVIPAASR